jgi:hypothetical protein
VMQSTSQFADPNSQICAILESQTQTLKSKQHDLSEEPEKPQTTHTSPRNRQYST